MSTTIGLSTYSFFWQWHAETVAEPITLTGMIDKTAALGATLLQICDYPLIESYTDEELRILKAYGDSKGVTFELGTRGVTPEHLALYLRLAQALDVTLVRSMLYTATSRPTASEAEQMLKDAVVGYEAVGVTLALETYEQVSSSVLVDIVTAVGSPNLGICLDPANCVAALEHPADVVRRTAPW